MITKEQLHQLKEACEKSFRVQFQSKPYVNKLDHWTMEINLEQDSLLIKELVDAVVGMDHALKQVGRLFCDKYGGDIEWVKINANGFIKEALERFGVK